MRVREGPGHRARRRGIGEEGFQEDAEPEAGGGGSAEVGSLMSVVCTWPFGASWVLRGKGPSWGC